MPGPRQKGSGGAHPEEGEPCRGTPRSPRAEVVVLNRVTGRYQQFKQAIERTHSGEWTPEDLQQFLLQIGGVLEEKGQACRQFIEESGYRDDAPDEVGEGISGLDLYEAGLYRMWEYFEDGDPTHLNEGLRMIWEGNEKINEAMRLNRESREDLDLSFFI